MNIAYSSIFIIFSLLPGFLFRYSFYSGKHLGKRPTNVFEFLLYSILPAICIQLAGLLCYEIFWDIDSAFMKSLFYIEKEENFKDVSQNLWYIIAYNVSLWAFGFFAGYASRQLVFEFRLDLLHPFFQLKSYWYYLFWGEIGALENREVIDFDILVLDILVDSSDGMVVYSGYLYNYFLTNSGELDNIVIYDVKRQKIYGDKTKEQKVIPGNLFRIPYSDIKNINLHFISFSKDILNLSTSDLQEI